MLSTTTRTITYTGNGSTTAFSVPWYWITDSHIVVEKILISSGAITAQVIGTDYTLVGAGNMGGGTLTMVAAPSSLYNLRISRTVPITQLQDYVAFDAMPAETVERGYDYLTMVCQQLSDSIAALGGTGYTFQNLGAGQGHVYAGTSGTTVQLKSFKGAGGTTITETSTEIQVSSSASGLDLTADYAWTGKHTHTKQAARTAPSWVAKSLQGGVDIVDSSILLASDYVAMMDLRKKTDVSVEAPVDSSWGGNFAMYVQHSISGTAGTFGTLAGGIRAQVESTQVHGVGNINDLVAFYGGVYNNGTDVGAFGFHMDVYHVGTAGASGHSSYGASIEMYKNISGGVAAAYVARQLGTQPLDFGMIIAASTGTSMKRGLQLGSPTYANGGLAGSLGNQTTFDVGIDLTWGQYGAQAISIPRDSFVGFSGVNQAQSATPDRTCEARWYSSTGVWWLLSGGAFKFGVNMTTGNLFGPGTNEQLSCWDTTTPWVLSFTSTNKVSSSANAGGLTAGSGGHTLTDTLLAGFIVMKIGGTTVKVPYFSL